MAEPSAPIDPDRILEHPFTAVRRGYDPLEVQRYLLQVANQLRAGREREADLRHQLDEELERKAPIDDLDPARLTRLLGEETARVLEAAQAAAADIRGKAEENVARLLREARDEAQQMRDEAESVLGRKTAEAEEAAAQVRSEADGVLESARSEAAELVEAGRQEGRAMVGEAQKVRQRMLDDLARRRKQLRQQIDQLQAGRERLMAAYEVVRETLDVATDELQVALPEAKLAAESVSSHDDHVDFEAELEAATNAVASAEASAAASAPAPADDERPDAVAEGETEASEDGGEVAPEAAGSDTTPDTAGDDGSDEEAGGETAAGDAPAAVDVDEPADVALGADDTDAASPREDSLAPDPEEGRRSSSVKVVRGKGQSGDKAADVFARLREGDATEPEAGADEEAPAAVADTEVDAAEATGETSDEAGGELPIAEEAADAAAEETAAEEAAADEPGTEEDEAPLEGPARLVAERDLAIADLERNLARRLKRELSDEQNELLSALAEAKGTPSAEDVLPDPTDHLGRIEAVALPTLAAAATAGAELLAVVGGRSSAANGSVADLAAQLAADVVGPLRERLERAFDGGDADEVAQRIRSSYREWKGQRVDALASYAVVAACNRGLLEHLPEGTMVQWVVAEGDAPSPDCEDNALAGSVVVGDAFPTGHVAPPLHGSCRCIVVPIDV
jgi:cell division septum initiation protein DivIVA